MIETVLLCMSLNLYFEARGEEVQGQIAVAEVTLNRVASPAFPDDICGVILQENEDGCQFSWWCDGRSDQMADENSMKRAKVITQLILTLLIGQKTWKKQHELVTMCFIGRLLMNHYRGPKTLHS
jgi:hypothetical protein